MVAGSVPRVLGEWLRWTLFERQYVKWWLSKLVKSVLFVGLVVVRVQVVFIGFIVFVFGLEVLFVGFKLILFWAEVVLLWFQVVLFGLKVLFRGLGVIKLVKLPVKVVLGLVGKERGSE